MAREGRNALAILVRTFIDSLKPRQFRGNLIGKDYLGNQYYELPKSDSRRKSSRWYVPPEGDEELFDKQLPAEWEAWLRYRRPVPPTEEEIQKNLEIMKTKKIKATEISKKLGSGGETPSQPSSFPVLEEFEQHPGKRPGQE